LLNSKGDLLPGLVCDVYGSSAVLKLWHLPLNDFQHTAHRHRLTPACCLPAPAGHTPFHQVTVCWNGEGDLLPGLVCDVYGSSAVLKLDGDGFTRSLNDQ
jgi:23S rRNA G2069 N7-methylase RlmK/C1962 C5-methylase RlmI